MTPDEIKKSLKNLISELEDHTSALQDEQDQSESEHDDWEEESGEEEPERIDNQGAIDQYSRCMSLLESALEELGGL